MVKFLVQRVSVKWVPVHLIGYPWRNNSLHNFNQRSCVYIFKTYWSRWKIRTYLTRTRRVHKTLLPLSLSSIYTSSLHSRLLWSLSIHPSLSFSYLRSNSGIKRRIDCNSARTEKKRFIRELKGSLKIPPFDFLILLLLCNFKSLILNR